MQAKHQFVTALIAVILMVSSFSATAQNSGRRFQIAKLQIDPAYLDSYKTALAEHAKTAIKVEPGVLALQAVFDKAHPTVVTIFEVYASESAYWAHLKSPHFLKYKTCTLKMVKSLSLEEVSPIAIELKTELASKEKQ